MWWDDDVSPEDEQSIRHLPFREMVGRVVPLFRPHLRLLVPGFLLLLVTVGAELAGPIVLRRIIDQSIPEGSARGIVRHALLYAGLFVVGTTAGYFQVVLLTKMGLRIVRRLKQSLFDHLLGLSLAYFDRNPPGRLLARVESDTERLQALFSEVALAVLRTMILVLGTLVVMLLASWQVTVALLCLALPIIVGTIFYFRWMRGLFRRVRAYYARISTFVSEYVQGVPILQVFGYERRAAARLARLNDDKLHLERNTTALEYGFWGLLTTVEVFAVMLILTIGSGRLFDATITVGTVVLFVDYTRRIFWPLAMFSEQVSFIQRAFASADRVFAILDTPSRTPDAPDARETVDPDWRELAFEDVSFVYDGGTRALDRVSFRIRRGEKVALVGLSGGGKTTITSLLLRYYEPTEGRIALDGDDIRSFRQRAWREKLGLVLQEIHLFPGTVRDNLRALVDDVPQEALERAVRIVGAEEVIARLPDGYDQELTEGGTNLSMGERQLLSFARAIVRDPDLLVLDEATSAVDPATERRLQDAVDRLLAGRTSLVIAHRLATIVSADRILVVHKGRLVEEGTHRDLYERGGIYRDLFDLQFKSGAVA
ncbi:MAG: ATP-binding cassette domain-containing protein [Candidatus Eisenbacteria bacterium]|nr:ATP-binding cassette domain-containing protein [Candidatus Latescibacterota bacterium]MBD3301300.1 ATP-binding cassette domain-containing protein [Candidatus Eisenbacteria bacterium]